VNLFYLVVERKYHNRTFGAFVMPIAFFMMVFAVYNDSSIHLLPMPWPPINPAGPKLDPRAENTEKRGFGAKPNSLSEETSAFAPRMS